LLSWNNNRQNIGKGIEHRRKSEVIRKKSSILQKILYSEVRLIL